MNDTRSFTAGRSSSASPGIKTGISPLSGNSGKLGGLVANLGTNLGIKRTGGSHHPSGLTPLGERPSISQNHLAGPVPVTKIDVAKLSEDGLDIDAYIHGLLQNLPTEEAVQQLYRSLNECNEHAASDIQKNVFTNYNEFVIISKEISKLEMEIMVMRGYLNELKDVHDDLRQFAGELDVSNDKDSSPVDDPLASPAQKLAAQQAAAAKQKQKEEELQETRQAQMKALYQTIDSLQKVLPETKTRYLIRDGTKTKCWEVDQNTYKTKDQAHIFIFNDMILIAEWKKNIVTGKSRLVAEHALNLSEIGFIDMRDSPDVTNAFKIMKHPDNYIYKTETLEEKRAILNCIKRVTDDILAQKRKEKDATKDKKGLMGPINTAGPSEDKEHKRSERIVKDNLSPTDYRWLVELPDELDVFIAHRDFDAAVAQIEKARKILLATVGETVRVQALRMTVEERTAALAKMITLDLASPVATKKQVQENIDRLLRLGLGDKARDIFLSARTATIRHRVKQLKFNGDVVAYISDLSEVTFRLIRNTCDWYSGSFRDNSMASGFMKWVQDEVDHLTNILRRQIFDARQSFTVIAEALICTLEQCEQLRAVGLDLTFMVDKIVLADISKAIDLHSEECNKLIVRSVNSDDFQPKDPPENFFEDRGLRFDVPIPKLSQSGYDLYEILTDFGSDVGPLMSLPMYGKIVGVISDYFDSYVPVISRCINQELSDIQYLTIVHNCTFLVEHVFPKVKSQLQERFNRSVPELENDFIRHQETLQNLHKEFITMSRTSLLKNCFYFPRIDYSNSADILDTLLPSDAILKLLTSINSIKAQINPMIDAQKVITDLLEDVCSFIATSTTCWEIDKKPKRFGYGGVQTLILDIHFFLKVTEKFITDPANDSANSICEKALRAYFSQNKDLSIPLKTQEWYDGRVADALKKYGKTLAALLE